MRSIYPSAAKSILGISDRKLNLLIRKKKINKTSGLKTSVYDYEQIMKFRKSREYFSLVGPTFLFYLRPRSETQGNILDRDVKRKAGTLNIKLEKVMMYDLPDINYSAGFNRAVQIFRQHETQGLIIGGNERLEDTTQLKKMFLAIRHFQVVSSKDFLGREFGGLDS